MVLDIKSSKFLSIPLFYSIYRIWNRMRYCREFACLFLLYLADEVELMIYNLIPYLQHKHRDEVLLYFIEEAKPRKIDGMKQQIE